VLLIIGFAGSVLSILIAVPATTEANPVEPDAAIVKLGYVPVIVTFEPAVRLTV